MTALEYLFSLEALGIKLGLDNIRRLLADLDRPDRAFHSIVIAGTNGKGSVTAMLERALRAAGWRTGRYTSPHLVSLNERFAVDGRPVSDDLLRASAARMRAVALTMHPPPTFFEATTAVACDLFKATGVDVGVMEVGLGGRLDATNALEPVATAITAVDFDHQDLLGSTLREIAGEKAGIIKPGVPIVLAPNPADVEDVVRTAARDRHAPVVAAGEGVDVTSSFAEGRLTLRIETPRAVYGPLPLGLRGRHQLGNALTLVRLAETIDETTAIGIPVSAIESGLRDVEWPGRLQLVSWQGAAVLVDAAHNPSGARALAAYVAEVHGRLPFVFGAMRDKDIAGILEPLAPVMTSLTLTMAATPRAASLDELDAAAARAAPDVPRRHAASPMAAIDEAAEGGATVAVAGSLYLAGDVLAALS
ncbi:MAG TPA: folylpolyglutamate synthase/dihydrofolate synthase family protein [Vicinamibacterales bacterium]|nr:folylpolyglutamate synthase/dihydrofolate synthase family protein [Vicinamibacterales bacterium]